MSNRTIANCRIVTWDFTRGEDLPEISLVRSALTAEGFDPVHARDVTPDLAFRRAVDEHAGKSKETKEDGTVQESTVKSVHWEKGGVHYAQLDRHSPTEDGRMERVRLVNCHLNGEAGRPQVRVTHGELSTRLDYFLTHYRSTDCTKAIRAAIKAADLNLFTIRDAVFVVATENFEFFDRLARACDRFGVLFSVWLVSDTSQDRQAVTQAIARGITEELQEHAQVIAGYTDSTHPNHLEGRRELIAKTRRLAERMALFLQEHCRRITDEASRLDAECVRLLGLVEAARAAQEAARHRGGRYIPRRNQPVAPETNHVTEVSHASA